MKNISLLVLFFLLVACQSTNNKSMVGSEKVDVSLTPSEVLEQSSSHEWRSLDLQNTLYMTLEAGTVIIELMPQLAPKHVMNTKALVRQGVFDNTNFYRVIDGFVAQGGPMFESEADMKQLLEGQYSVPSELTRVFDLTDGYISFDTDDGYADETGFLHSFPIGRDLTSGESWMLHCYGALGMGRANELDSGGTELYIVNGHAQRYLDRNVTIFGRVVAGMPYIQSLKRGGGINGPVDLNGENIIESIQVAADIPKDDQMQIEVLDSSSKSFRQLLTARKNRTGQWFVYQHDYMDACGVPIPTRLAKPTKGG